MWRILSNFCIIYVSVSVCVYIFIYIYAYTLPTRSIPFGVLHTPTTHAFSFYVAHGQTVSHLLLNGINKSPALSCAFSQASFDNDTKLLSQVPPWLFLMSLSYVHIFSISWIHQSQDLPGQMWRQDSIVQHPLSPMSKQKPGLTS